MKTRRRRGGGLFLLRQFGGIGFGRALIPPFRIGWNHLRLQQQKKPQFPAAVLLVFCVSSCPAFLELSQIISSREGRKPANLFISSSFSEMMGSTERGTIFLGFMRERIGVGLHVFVIFGEADCLTGYLFMCENMWR
jgi:hypothetical protein